MTDDIPIQSYILTSYDKYKHLQSKTEKQNDEPKISTQSTMEEKAPESTSTPEKPVSSPSENVEIAKKEPYASSSHQNPSESGLKERVEIDALIQKEKNKLDECELDNWWQIL